MKKYVVFCIALFMGMVSAVGCGKAAGEEAAFGQGAEAEVLEGASAGGGQPEDGRLGTGAAAGRSSGEDAESRDMASGSGGTEETAKDGWKVRLTFSSDIALENGWNGTYEAEGSTLTISSMDYNGYIGKGGSVENVGFIIRAEEGCRLEE